MNNLHSIDRRPVCKQQSGFTLIELMVVVAIVAILATIGYPSYQEQVAKSRRADAQRALGEAEQYMRRYFSTRDTFVGAQIPAGTATSPRPGSGAAMYNIELIEGPGAVATATQASTYTLRATRTGGMTGDRCGNLSVTNTGVKFITGLTGLTPAELETRRAECFKAS